MTADRPHDRRRYGRVHLLPPLQGMVDTTRVSVIEVSVTGARVMQEGRIAGAGTHRFRFEWEQRPIEFSCDLVRTTVGKLAKKPGESTLYVTGIKFTNAHDESELVLRELISEHVVRAINEQIANAHGLPPLAAISYETEKSGRYRRCEFNGGGWRRSDTPNAAQPENGFTISADVDPYYVELLCRTYEALDENGRELTRLFAQLSADGKEGAPTRRYLP